jgi:hypothetical protein
MQSMLVIAQLLHAATLVRVDRVTQELRLQGLNRRNLPSGAQGHGNQYRQRQKQSLRHPE